MTPDRMSSQSADDRAANASETPEKIILAPPAPEEEPQPEESPVVENSNGDTASLPADSDELPPLKSRTAWHKSKKTLWPAIALAMLAVAGFVAWRAYQSTLAPDAAETEAPESVQSRLPVRTIRAETGLIQGWLFDEGGVLPVRRRILNFQANGDITYVAKIGGVELKEGDPVSRGQLLAKIDSRRQRSSIQTARADIEVSKTQRFQSEASLEQARANLERARSDLAFAQTELRRYEVLYKEGAVSANTRDTYRNRVDQAAAALKTSEQDVISAQQGVRSADASIDASRARLNQTAVDLEDTQLVSPIDGVVAYINIRQGEYWSSQYLNTSSPQQTLETAPIVIVDPRSFEVELELQAGEAEKVRPGQLAYAVLEEEVSAARAAGASDQGLIDIAKQRGSRGRVFSVSPSQTPGSRGTEVVIRGLESGSNLKVGGRVYVWIEVASKADALVLPQGALVSRDQQFYVFVVNEADGTATQRRITPGIEGLSGIEIIEGVKPGDRVVVEGQNLLVDGTPVEMVERGKK